MSDLPADAPVPRLCHLIKWPDFDGYGFNLHAEKQRSGQYIGKVDEDSPAQHAGLKEGDRIIEVNGVNIANENHRQVVERIKANSNETKLLVVDDEADKWYRERKIVVKSTQSNVRFVKTPSPRPSLSDPPNYENISNNDENETSVDSGMNGKIHRENGKPTKTEMNGTNGVIEQSKLETRTSANGHSNSYEEKSNGIPTNDAAVKDRSPHGRRTGNIVQNVKNININKEEETSRSSTPLEGSTPDSPHSTKSSRSSGASSQNGPSSPEPPTVSGDLNLNMSASEMRQMLASRKKKDPKKIQMDIRKKYEIIQQM